MRLRIVFALALALGLAGLAPPSAAVAQAQRCALGPGEHRVRGQLVRVPGNAGRRPALVLGFHGLAGNGPGIAAGIGLDAVAAREGFVTAYPKSRGRDWQLNLKRGNHDLPMTRRLIDRLVRLRCADPRRVYATGFSNGASFAARLGCDLSTRIAAIAPVSGSYVAQRRCPRSRGRMPTLEIHGQDQFLPSVARLLRMTAARNRCGSRTVSTRLAGGGVRTAFRPRCALERITYRSIGHAWPAGGAERVWAFVRRYRR